LAASKIGTFGRTGTQKGPFSRIRHQIERKWPDRWRWAATRFLFERLVKPWPMKTLAKLIMASLLLAGAACNKTEKAPSAPPPAATPPAPPPAPVEDPRFAAPPDVAAPPADAEKTASGLASKVLTKGTGTEHPAAHDVVKVHYTGWTTNGKMFDSSVKRGEPTEFPLNRVIPGWTEGVQLMVQGEKRRFWIPVELAYNHRPGAPDGMLVFDVELLAITKTPPPPPPPEVPADVKAPPKTAKKTKTGIFYRVLKKGTGKEHPQATNTVEVHYSGWTTDGKMFDSSVVRGQPTSFPLNGVIAGWTEGVQLMVVGEKTRFWIPGNLAYGEKNDGSGRPFGMLVFDIELLGIK
jgi:peptidylprolyl isomerase